jgi:hypothetical protein
LHCSFAAKKHHEMVLEVFLIMMVAAVVSDVEFLDLIF